MQSVKSTLVESSTIFQYLVRFGVCQLMNIIVGKVEKVEKVEEEKKKEKKVKKAKKTKKGEKSELSSTVASSIFTSVSVMQLRSDGTLIGESEEDIGEDHESEEEEEQLSGDTSLLQMKKKTQAQSTTSRKHFTIAYFSFAKHESFFFFLNNQLKLCF